MRVARNSFLIWFLGSAADLVGLVAAWAIKNSLEGPELFSPLSPR